MPRESACNGLVDLAFSICMLQRSSGISVPPTVPARRGCIFNYLSFSAVGLFRAEIVKDDYKLLVFLGCQAVGAGGFIILMIDTIFDIEIKLFRKIFVAFGVFQILIFCSGQTISSERA